MQERKSGILLHPTSLPFSAGIGTVGRSAFKFIDWLEKAGVGLWQVLPLGPTGYGDSPYQSFSAFALNPLLIDLDDLAEDGFAERRDAKVPDYVRKSGNIDYGSVVWWKTNALKSIARKFIGRISAEKIGNPETERQREDFHTFVEENRFWLKDFAAFMSIKNFYDAKAEEERRGGADVCSAWNVYWSEHLSRHDGRAVRAWLNSHADVKIHEAVQFFAFSQWRRLKDYANSKGIKIVGDVPIFVAADSADVWAHQNLFQLEKDGSFKAVAGVPPDYFSETGQLWGNPLYDWDAMKKEKYSWWVSRIERMLELVDYVRIDHFRGFESYWAVPPNSENAINGTWMPGPGKPLFDAIRKGLNFGEGEELPLIAEDLGVITDEVAALRDECGLPGMKVLQFGFDKNEYEGGAMKNAFLPHSFSTENCVAYTGTHDNDTTQGFLESLPPDFASIVASYAEGRKVGEKEAVWLARSGRLVQSLVRVVFASTARVAVVPLQDVYAVGSEGRMNMPSTTGANWSFRASRKMLRGREADEKAAWLRELNVLYNR